MKIADALDMRGRLTIHRYDASGQPIDTTATNNAIVYSGRDLVAKLFAQQAIDPIRYIAVGTGGEPVNPDTDTKLAKEVFRKELKGLNLAKDLTDIQMVVPTESGEKEQKSRRIVLSADLDFEEPNPSDNGGKPYELREAGLFNAGDPNAGIMYNRVVFPNISKTKDFKLTLVWEIIF
ncbi:hypothetical protein QGP82_10160 [Leptothoe sp. LEGE 181152]|nr:hypothetical protein [Leptothoe sp. LEGE 181152]